MVKRYLFFKLRVQLGAPAPVFPSLHVHESTDSEDGVSVYALGSVVNVSLALRRSW